MFGVHGDAGFGSITDTASWRVEDASQAHGVVFVGENAQVRDDVPNFLALVEANAADHLVRHAESDEDLLERT